MDFTEWFDFIMDAWVCIGFPIITIYYLIKFDRVFDDLSKHEEENGK